MKRSEPIRIRGFKGHPEVVSWDGLGVSRHWVCQGDDGLDGANMCGPVKPTRDEAIKAWNRLARTIINTEAK